MSSICLACRRAWLTQMYHLGYGVDVDMSAMFHGASSATPDVSRWDVNRVVDMGYVFKFYPG